MIRTITMQHEDGRLHVLETAMNDFFLHHMFPGWRVISRV